MSRMNHNKPNWNDSDSSKKGHKLKPNAWDSVSRGLENSNSKWNYVALLLVGIIGTVFDFFIRNKKAKKQILQLCSILVAIGNLLMACFKNTGRANLNRGRNRKYNKNK